ncbi:phospholipid-transporting P-type ATPase [Blattamonas nauphoetae]|uniref:Phospholipid-transporting P-type ATPase n=1 Tax=Blattamonas nauphoetae TaxID=2049346 RepID=A0ABQ9XPU8_9EUKA|nr:phospholipid-transporting P-type ATPase [Blattamonas nauphoetae]
MVIALLPATSIANPVTAVIPVIFIFTVTMIREGFEDYRRHRADRKINEALVRVFDGNEFKDIFRKDIKVGDFVIFRKDEEIGCDGIVLSTSDTTGISYVNTMNLDGETNMKLKRSAHAVFKAFGALQLTQKPPSPKPNPLETETTENGAPHQEEMRAIVGAGTPGVGDPSLDQENLWEMDNSNKVLDEEKIAEMLKTLKGEIVCQPPNRHIHEFSGRYTITPDEGSETVEMPNLAPVTPAISRFASMSTTPDFRSHTSMSNNSGPQTLSLSNFILRGCYLKNIDYLLCVAVYTGADTKMQMNIRKTTTKTSTFSSRVNIAVGFQFTIMVIQTLIGSIINVSSAVSMKDDHPYLFLAPQNFGTYFVALLTCFGVNAFFIPVSLFVTIEICRVLQSALIHADKKMRDESRGDDGKTDCRTSSLHEELGLIKHIFTDKTGTLTKNKMTLRAVSIGKTQFLFDVSPPDMRDNDNSRPVTELVNRFNRIFASFLNTPTVSSLPTSYSRSANENSPSLAPVMFNELQKSSPPTPASHQSSPPTSAQELSLSTPRAPPPPLPPHFGLVPIPDPSQSRTHSPHTKPTPPTPTIHSHALRTPTLSQSQSTTSHSEVDPETAYSIFFNKPQPRELSQSQPQLSPPDKLLYRRPPTSPAVPKPASRLNTVTPMTSAITPSFSSFGLPTMTTNSLKVGSEEFRIFHVICALLLCHEALPEMNNDESRMKTLRRTKRKGLAGLLQKVVRRPNEKRRKSTNLDHSVSDNHRERLQSTPLSPAPTTPFNRQDLRTPINPTQTPLTIGTTGDTTLKYQSTSPDDIAFLTALSSYGLVFAQRSHRSMDVFVQNIPCQFRILAFLPFTSTRRRMSVLVEFPDKTVRLYTKGADSTVISMCQSKEESVKEEWEGLDEADADSDGDVFDIERERDTQPTLRQKSNYFLSSPPHSPIRNQTNVFSSPFSSVIGPIREIEENGDEKTEEAEKDEGEQEKDEGAKEEIEQTTTIELEIPKFLPKARTEELKTSTEQPSLSNPFSESGVTTNELSSLHTSPTLPTSPSQLLANTNHTSLIQHTQSLSSPVGDLKSSSFLPELDTQECDLDPAPIITSLDAFSADGLRTLAIATRELTKLETDAFKALYEQAQLSITERDKAEEEAFQSIETGMMLIGGTAVEDELQDDCPETIQFLRECNIKIWVLTGDKVDTAVNIAFSTKLFGPDTTPLYLTTAIVNEMNQRYREVLTNHYSERGKTGDLEKEMLEDVVGLLLADLQKYKIEIKKEKPKPNTLKQIKKAIMYPFHACSSSIREARHKKDLEALDQARQHLEELETKFGHQNDSKPKNGVEKSHFGIVVDGQTLQIILSSSYLIRSFMTLCTDTVGVVCCRIAPMQKALVVRMVQTEEPGLVSLAVGDGANDVSMIQEARVGVGVLGKEGTAASRTADYSISQFSFLKRLIVVHGQSNYQRMSEMVKYQLGKNEILMIPVFVRLFFSAFSFPTHYEPWFMTVINLFLLAFPPFFLAILHQHFPQYILEKYPALFRSLQRGHNFNVFSFMKWFICCYIAGIWLGFVTQMMWSYGCVYSNGMTGESFEMTTWQASMVMGFCIQIFLHISSWNLLSLISVLASVAFYFAMMSVFAAGLSETFYLVFMHTLSTPLFWVTFLLGSVPISVVIMVYRWLRREFNPSASDRLHATHHDGCKAIRFSD